MDARSTHASLLVRLTDRADSAAWAEFLERYSDLLRGFARRRGLGPHECDDIVQEVVAALVASIPSFTYDPARGRFRGYLKTIATRAIARRHAQRARATPLEDHEPPSTADAEADAQWESEWRQYHMRLAMRTIDQEFNARDRAAFQRYALDGESVRATADAVGLSVEQVYQAKSRILRRLSELISAQIADEG